MASFQGTPGDDLLTGGTGTDFFRYSGGNDTYIGGDDPDSGVNNYMGGTFPDGSVLDLSGGISLTGPYQQYLFGINDITLSGNNITIQGADAGENAYVIGTNAVIYGNGGDDALADIRGAQLFGGDGDDTLRFSPVGTFSLGDGGAGDDRVNFTFLRGDYGVIDRGNALLIQQGARQILITDTVESLRFTGSPAPGEQLLFTYAELRAVAGGQIFGTSGRDRLEGSVLSDEIFGGDSNDVLIGGDGSDILVAGRGDDILRGGAGVDTAVIDAASAEMTAFTVTLVEGGLRIISGDGNDYISNSVEFITFNDTTLSYDALAARVIPPDINGTAGNDTLTGSYLSERLSGRGGNDWLFPGTGNDTLDGGPGTDMASFSDYAQAVSVDLGAGRALSGGDTKAMSGIENVTGSIFGDFLLGDAGANLLRGLGGYDWFVATQGADTYDGGSGRDMVSYINAEAGVTLHLGAGVGLAGMAAGHSYLDIERVTGSVFDDIFYGSDGSDEFRAAGGADLFYDSDGRDRYDGGAGIDTVSYALSAQGVNASLLRGTGGRDRDFYTAIENLIGSNRDDMLTGDQGRNVLRGGHGNDTLLGLGGNDYLEGGTGNDVLDGGLGYDVALYRNAASQYTVSTVGNITTVSHATDGIDTLTGIEALRFADGFDYL